MNIAIIIDTNDITEEDLQYMAFRMFKEIESVGVYTDGMGLLGVSRDSNARGYASTFYALQNEGAAAAIKFPNNVVIAQLNEMLAEISESV